MTSSWSLFIQYIYRFRKCSFSCYIFQKTEGQKGGVNLWLYLTKQGHTLDKTARVLLQNYGNFCKQVKRETGFLRLKATTLEINSTSLLQSDLMGKRELST